MIAVAGVIGVRVPRVIVLRVIVLVLVLDSSDLLCALHVVTSSSLSQYP